ncbi:hypothetical protein JTE90_023716 [Oedothorax gibbosus]|uniref:FAM86 N-terminal domain-containing protein n=1 Tax=Oedothorax gibbosus TaxID=931172 RepID=A0AAV6VBV1_9ARAC|nr:hypothetical protein JTE90_023716 [Oedothorax gibbosus]
MEVFSPLTVETQTGILNVTIKNPTSKKFPPPLTFRKMFLKSLINIVEKYGSECSDDLVEEYSRILSEQVDDNEGYFSYKINEVDTITLQENTSFVAESTTGLQTWEASKYLSEWCIKNHFVLENKSILELGSGIGLLGITVLKFCSPSKYMFSDKSWAVLNKLAANIKINFENADNLPIEQHQLVWTTMNDEDAQRLLPDVILGADLVYDADMIESLVHALKTTLLNSSSCAYIANTIRNPETNEKFLNHLGAADLIYEELKTHEKDIFVYNKSSSFKMYKISKNKINCC